MFEEAQDCLNISECLSGDFCPKGWDSRAIVSNLRCSQLGRNPFVRCPVSLANGRKILKEATTDSGFLGIQRHAYALFKPKFDISRFRFLFARRLTSSLQALGCLAEAESVCSSGLAQLEASLLKETMHVRMLYLKTLAGAWTTSVRMHEKEIKTCLFGCPESLDEVGHYLRCPVLWVCIDLRAPPQIP